MTVTDCVILAIVAVVVIFDVAVSVAKVPTVSERIWFWIHRHPVVAFVAGMVCGHLFWQR